jgi:hypothetical protein
MDTSKDDHIKAEIVTTKYLGTIDIAVQLLTLLSQYDIPYLPEKWGIEEPPRHVFDPTKTSPVIEEWIAPEESKHIFFSRKRPSPSNLWINMKRHERAKFNYINVYISDKYISDTGNEKEVLQFTLDICLIVDAAYGFISHRKQERRQSYMLTPAERLSGIYWANFFGRPYINFFGQEKLLAAPCHQARKINDDIILLLTAESPLQPEMIENDNVTNVIKAYLNQNAFAGPRFPDEACAVPEFDFSDLRRGTTQLMVESPEQKANHIIEELSAKGYKLLRQTPDILRFQGTGNSVVIVDLKTGSISLDITKST